MDGICTVQEAAERLNVHVKTVLRYIRNGTLKATRIGKAYRIRERDLLEFAGVPVAEQAAVPAARVSSIVDIDGVGEALAQKWARTVNNALYGKPAASDPMRVDTIYDPERQHLKIVVVGSPIDTMNLLGLIAVWIEQLE